MYNLPDGFTGSFLVGREVEVISFGVAQADICFSDNVWVSISEGYGHYDKRRTLQETRDFPLMETSLLRLMGARVLAVSVEGNDLRLRFDNQQELVVMGDNDHYECYIIYQGAEQLIIYFRAVSGVIVTVSQVLRCRKSSV